MKKEFVCLAMAASLLVLAHAVTAQTSPAEDRWRCANQNPQKSVYFGDLHSHTTYSYDAPVLGTRGTPRDAFRFAKGAPIEMPPYEEAGAETRSHRLARPLDFLAVTDHAEYFGEVRACLTCQSGAVWPEPCEDEEYVYESDGYCKKLRKDVAMADSGMTGPLSLQVLKRQTKSRTPIRNAICKPSVSWCPDCEAEQCWTDAASVWQDVQDAANEAYDPCEFTSFVAYEWTGTPNGANWHRNVIFRNENVPGLPFSYLETGPDPEKLWKKLDFYCKPSEDCDVLVIPHNANLSSELVENVIPLRDGKGTLFPLPEDSGDVEFQLRYERLAEIHQTKGNSECRYGVRGGADTDEDDELCQFELMSKLDLAGKIPAFGPLGHKGALLSAEEQGFTATIKTGGTYNQFMREVLKAGLYLGNDALGANPYKLGFVGGSDTHVATPGATEEWDYKGHHGTEDNTLDERLSMTKRLSKPKGEQTADTKHGKLEDNPAGLTAIWAEENTRDALFDSLRNRETYATSGIRPTVRFFAGWDLPEDLCDREDFVRVGYDEGVPMGSDFGPGPDATSKPRFAVMATRDADYDAKLQRIQIIKGWIDSSGTLHEDVIDAVSAPGDLSTMTGDDYVAPASGNCEPIDQDLGADTLCKVWTDKSFESTQSAFYYVRVLENPTCRWSTLQCIELASSEGLPSPKDHACWNQLVQPAQYPCDDDDNPLNNLLDKPPDCDLPGVKVGLTIQERAWTSAIWYEPSP